MSLQAEPSQLPKFCITKEIWYPPLADTPSKPLTTANPRDHSPRNKTCPNHKRKSRFFLHEDNFSKPPTNTLPFHYPATPPPTPQSSFNHSTHCSPILCSPSLLLPVSLFPSPPHSPLPSPIAPPSPYCQRHQKPKEECEQPFAGTNLRHHLGSSTDRPAPYNSTIIDLQPLPPNHSEGKEEAYVKLGSAALLTDNVPLLEYCEFRLKDGILYFEDKVSHVKDRVPNFGSGHGQNGRDIDTKAVKKFFREQKDKRMWNVIMSTK